ncbi:MAG: bifunctional diaminohydroxyphosphoribosylaminopyrimidine deaminase/5-amino-6-(5-phosphoribosylamino)uracil reductase RibD [Candidatus Tantalella remota]|nr:bifunctional diaminohydroxyphosphoribosylaminopyrimidine deaminase/5-amino-6-(5-phosphoribosylamino)uracil reductase RibD [Candidatus Tantalella remota]
MSSRSSGKNRKEEGLGTNKMKKDAMAAYMEEALKLAAKATDRTYPNPMVGALIVKSGKVVGAGYHRRAGEPHAEVNAIREASAKCRNATLFVTLEPCDHFGKTPPCTEAVISSGIKEVVIAMRDPNPLNSGRGIRRLKKAGITVITGILEQEAKYFNRKYIKYITEDLPYVTLKLAQSVDGKIAARNGTSRWISSETSRAAVRKMRKVYDAIMVGAGTVAKDDPLLLAEEGKSSRTVRVIVDSRLRIFQTAKVIKTAKKSPVIIGTTELAPAGKIKKLNALPNVEVVVQKSKKGRVPLRSFLKELAGKGIVNILSEGGGELSGSLLDESLADEAIFFIAPILLGGEASSVKGKGVSDISKAISLEDVSIRPSGGDIFLRGRISKKGIGKRQVKKCSRG